ncbi:MAG: MBL fold metallo-hydrolase [Clostridia bacterium]|nr:MBL fold metallo-hydrolase [Clostridia bacterium]
MAFFYLLGSLGSYQSFGAVLLSEDQTVIFDGGLMEEASQILTLLESNGRDRVDAWFFTHPHHDHIGAFFALHNQKKVPPLGRLYAAFPDQETLERCPAHRAHGGVEREMWNALPDVLAQYKDRYTPICRGDAFSFGEVRVRVLRTINPNFDVKRNFINNSSAVLMIEGPKKKILLLGDLGEEGGEELLRMYPPEALRADYTQMAHHGQLGVNRSFYEAVRPACCLWPTPACIWENDGGAGPDTGKWKTLETRKWMEEMGVREHLVAKDGTARIEI